MQKQKGASMLIGILITIITVMAVMSGQYFSNKKPIDQSRVQGVQQNKQETVKTSEIKANREIPSGFSNAKDSVILKNAWRNKSLLLTATDSIEQQVAGKYYCWDFNNFDDAKVYQVKMDGTKRLMNSDKAYLELREYINVNSPGIDPGDYVLSFVSVGNTSEADFKTIINGNENRFVDNRGEIFEIKPSGYCTNNL